MDSAFVQLSQSTETHHESHHRVATKVTDTSASFDESARSRWMTKTATDPVLSQHLTKHVVTSGRQVTNGIGPVTSPGLNAKNRHHVEVPLVGDTSEAAEVRQSRPRPAIAVIQLSGSSADDRVVYHEPQINGTGPSRGRGETTVTVDHRALPPPLPTQSSATSSKQQSTATLNGGGPGQVPEGGAKLPYRPANQAPVSRASNGDSWKRRKAMKLAKRHTAEKEQGCRQT